jgi:hypothetical protein
MPARAKNGHQANDGMSARDPAAAPVPQTPLDFALGLMRDDGKPDALRAIMARAAMPYLHKRGAEHDEQEDETQEQPISDFELARRIAHILGLAEAEGFDQLRAAQEAAAKAERHAQEMERRALTAEALIGNPRRQQEAVSEPAPKPSSATPDEDLLAHMTTMQDKLRIAEERARVSEAQAQDLQNRLLANEEVLANACETGRHRF